MTRRVACVHTGDYVAWRLFVTGRWLFDVAAGVIYSRRTGQPVRFSAGRDGYLRTKVQIHGMSVSLLKHRAVWVVAHGVEALPLEYGLEVDHVNHDRADCRLENLRLVTRAVNSQSRPCCLSPAEGREIRRRYDAGGMSVEGLAMEFGMSYSAVLRLVRRRTYRDPAYEPEEV